MRSFVENFPFFSIFLALLAGIVTATIRSGRVTDLNFTYTMGRFLAPYGNAIKCGPFQALLATVFSAVMATSLAGGRRDLFQDVLPEKQRLYFVMVDMLEASLLALTYTNDAFTG